MVTGITWKLDTHMSNPTWIISPRKLDMIVGMAKEGATEGQEGMWEGSAPPLLYYWGRGRPRSPVTYQRFMTGQEETFWVCLPVEGGNISRVRARSVGSAVHTLAPLWRVRSGNMIYNTNLLRVPSRD